MKILSELNQPYSLIDINDPVIVNYFWGYSALHQDFMHFPIMYLEELTGPAVKIRIGEEILTVPSNWNIMICDPETTIIDMIDMTQAMGSSFSAFGFSTEKTKIFYLPFEVVDVMDYDVVVMPSIQRSIGLCHPAGKAEGYNVNVVLSSSDIMPKDTMIVANDLLF